MENDQSHIVFVEDDTCIKTYDTQDETIYLDLGLLQKVVDTESSDLMGKIENLFKTLEEQKSVKQPLVEEKSKAQAEFEDPVITPTMELAPRSFSDIFGHKTVPPLIPPTSKMKLFNEKMEKELAKNQYCHAVPSRQHDTLQGLRSPLVNKLELAKNQYCHAVPSRHHDTLQGLRSPLVNKLELAKNQYCHAVPSRHHDTLQGLRSPLVNKLELAKNQYCHAVPSRHHDTLQGLRSPLVNKLELAKNQYCHAVPSRHHDTLQGLRSPLVKKLSLWGCKPELQQQLRIDTRQDHVNTKSMYNPQLEVISPTCFLDSILEDPNFRTIKDDLLLKISKVDQEISVAENTILKLKKKEQELACQPDEKKDEEEESLVDQPMKYLSLAHNIYTENRRKAQKAHLEMEKMGPKVEFPLYNQPKDTVVYNENRSKHFSFKNRLLEHLSNKSNKKKAREEYLTQTYSKLVQEWHQKVDKIQNSVEKKAEDAKRRELFEKEFPELRKQREDRERSREGVMVTRSKARSNVKETVDRVQEQEVINKLRLRGVIPPLLLDAEQRRHCYISNNQKIEDLNAEYKEQKVLNIWTKEEKEIFKEKFLKHPKNFVVIASYFNCKSVCDCVQFYYHNKKKENYKQLLRQQKLKQRQQQGDIYPKG